MKKILLLALSLAVLTGYSKGNKQTKNDGPKMIATVTPKRPAGQTDVLELVTTPIPKVRVAFIGLGMRGPGAVDRISSMPNVEVVALCDVEQKNTEKVNKKLEEKGLPKAQEFYGDTEVWRKVTALPNVDLIYIATDWKHHAPIGIQGMKDGKHVAIEVPSAMTMDEIWELINTSEKTRKHCIPLENCNYDFFEMTALNMARQGVFGEVLHGEGAYIHGLDGFWNAYWKDGADDKLGWRMDYNRKHSGDLYPTHGLGPICQVMNIHRGDKMNYLVSMDTKPANSIKFIKDKTGIDASDFKNGEHTSTLIRTENGKTILIEHNVNSPRPYSRMYQLTGTEGFAEKYPKQGFALNSKNLDSSVSKDFENLNAHSYVSDDVREALMKQYKPISDDFEKMAKEMGGHGGMDFIMDYRMIYCLQNGLHMDMDVYDLAEWSCPIPLTEISIENGSAPVEIPDFTRGAWNKLKTIDFAEAEGKPSGLLIK